MKTVAIYERVSTLHQKEEGYSIGEQEERLQLFAKAHGWLVVDVYSDPGFSGGKLDRPAMQRLIRDAKAHKFDAVIIYKLDRLSRSQKDTLYLIEDVFNPAGVGLISMLENFDTTTSFGKAMIGILSVFAQLERGQITERMTMGRIGRAKAGYYSGGSRPPIGYTYSRAEGGEKKTLQVDEYEALQVRTVFQLFLEEGCTFKEICRRMHAQYKNRYGDWSHVSTVCRVLRDRTYLGEVSFGGTWYPGVHTPIIDAETFEAAQKKYKMYMDTPVGTFSKNFKGAHLLTGMVRCGLCGSRFYVKTSVIRHGKNPATTYKRYACYAATGQRKVDGRAACTNVRISVDDLDARIIEEVRKLSVDPALVRSLASGKNEEKSADERAALEARLAELSKQEEKLIDLYQVGALDLEIVKKRADAIKEEREKVNATLVSRENTEAAALSADEAIQMLGNFEQVFSSGDLQDKRSLLRSLIDVIVVFPDRVEIHWAFAAKK